MAPAAGLPKLRITDYALESLAEALSSREPEQGGALLGIRGADVITTFVHDAKAPVTSVTYANTGELITEIARIEEETAARFKGIVHSHPSTMAAPSEQDLREYAHSLTINPAMTQYLALIVTLDLRRPLEPHEIACGTARISCFGVTTTSRGSRLSRFRPHVIGVQESIRRAGARLAEGEPVLIDIDGVPMICAQIERAGLHDASLLFSVDHPAVAPLLIRYDTEAVQEPIPWDLRLPAADRLARGLETIIVPRSAQASEPADASFPGAAPVVAAANEPRPAGAAVNVLFARTQGVLSHALSERHVLVVGAGSVGAYVAENLVRSGVGQISLVDPDVVEPANLGRAPFGCADVGKPKVTALADRLRSINPDLITAQSPGTVDEIDPAELLGLVRSADLVVAATDDNRAQQRLNHLAYWANTPAVFIGLYALAAGGEIIATYPGGPCWQCSTGNARIDRSSTTRRTTDYGTGRLEAEPGLLPDIHFVSAAGTKVALALLHTPDDPAATASFMTEPRANNQNLIVFGMVPRFEFFPRLFQTTPAQYAFQSAWLSAEPQPECPICGDPESRSDPPTTTTVPTNEQILRNLSPHDAGSLRLGQPGPVDVPAIRK